MRSSVQVCFAVRSMSLRLTFSVRRCEADSPLGVGGRGGSGLLQLPLFFFSSSSSANCSLFHRLAQMVPVVFFSFFSWFRLPMCVKDARKSPLLALCSRFGLKGSDAGEEERW